MPPALDERTVPGALVAAPLGGRVVLGVVAGRGGAGYEGRLSALAGAVDAQPVPPDLLDLALWVARYYRAPVAASLKLVLPPGSGGALRRGRDGAWRLATPPSGGRSVLVVAVPEGATPASSPRRRAIVAALAEAGGRLPAAELCRRAGTTPQTLRRMAEDREIALGQERLEPGGPAGLGEPASEPPRLNAEQVAAAGRLEAAIDGGTAEALLLHGVTGSGKTEVYLRAIVAARRHDRGSLVLVPEIALTPQLLARLRGRLGEGVAVWHSGLSAAHRAREHRRVRTGEADVVLGARSAVFAPVRSLGLVVVDEEHEASYKQDTVPRYDARQVAYRRAFEAGAALVYGTATPRPETWRALPRVELTRRADGARPPRVEVVDMRTQPPGPVSRPLASALRDAVARREKAILLLNRRGFSLMVLCRACGWIATCPDCEVAMVRHRAPPRLVCHHCGREEAPPAVCPSCGAAEVARLGAGTQGLEEAIAALVPDARLVRLDADTTSARGAVDHLLAEFARPGAAVLLGTQMVAKGHDLPEVTVAAVLDADAPLAHADFRAEERAFGLIVQAIGRAGRRGEPARAFVQAYQPNARAVALGVRAAVDEFLSGELERRRRQGFPPFGHLARLVVEGEDAATAGRLAGEIAAAVRDAPEVRLLGPARLHRLRGRTRWALLARAERAGEAAAPLEAAAAARGDALRRAGARAVLDVDPQDT